jgi:hypothetical protein
LLRENRYDRQIESVARIARPLAAVRGSPARFGFCRLSVQVTFVVTFTFFLQGDCLPCRASSHQLQKKVNATFEKNKLAVASE